MNIILKYIIIDDDPINNMVCSLLIKKTLDNAETTSFTSPEDAISAIEGGLLKDNEPVILLLDINMPTLTGWEFMEQYENFDQDIKDSITVYMLSSSVNQMDKDRASANPLIKGFVSKPLLANTILAISGGKYKGL